MTTFRRGSRACRDGRVPAPLSPALLLLTLVPFAPLAAGCRSVCSCDRLILSPTQVPYTSCLLTLDEHFRASNELTGADRYLAAATRLEAEGDARCVDQYFQAAAWAWRSLDLGPESQGHGSFQSACQTYQTSLERLIATGCRYRRLDPRGHLRVWEANVERNILIRYHGFPWKPQEFTRLMSSGNFQHHVMERHYEAPGLGVSLVAIRRAGSEEAYYPPQQHFPVTAVLRSRPILKEAQLSRPPVGVLSEGGIPGDSAGCDVVLEFYNPYRHDSLILGSHVVGMARDLTAPLASLLEETPRRYTEGLFDPDDAEVRPRMTMIEPYQQGKIPVVFIHGLWSDPVTWADMANDLNAQGDIYCNYQFWFFRYPTGRGILESAAELRESLAVAREVFDPDHEDTAMEQIILVGHSMGGLVAKLQVTHSHDILWRSAASQELDSVRTTPAMRERLRRAFFFEPSPLVTRVIFIGTPHRGSADTRRVASRVTSRLVRISETEEAQYRQLMDNNRDIFAEYLWDRWPTSIDLLDPSNPILQALSTLPIDSRVRRHTIIGTFTRDLHGDLSDGVVSLSSARQSGVRSELLIPVRHGKLHHHADSSRHLMGILREHAGETAGGVSNAPDWDNPELVTTAVDYEHILACWPVMSSVQTWND
jgi:pimeloyl-ACP methyl ester carboxylesterase